MDWSNQQLEALGKISRWLSASDRQVFYLAGYAGTGKTTIATHFTRNLPLRVGFAAFTGKAASVLRKQGCDEARTLHSLLYDVTDADKTELRRLESILRKLQAESPEEVDEALRIATAIEEVEKDLRAERERTRGPRFRLNPESAMKELDLLVLDECSMVSKKLGEDVLSFGKKVLVLGDPAQLPPVRGAGYFTNHKPDYLLTEIHRQAADNAIIRAAHAVREGRNVPCGLWGDRKELAVVERSEVTGEWVADRYRESGTQILCGMNKVRRKWNRTIRKKRIPEGRSIFPHEGEKLVVLKNDSELGVLNGVTCFAASEVVFDDEFPEPSLRLDYEGEIIPATPFDPTPFRIYREPKLEEEWHPKHAPGELVLDFGYAITVHKSQGSEWDEVFFWDDGFGSRDPTLRQQWVYTAITRASERLVIVKEKSESW